MAHRESQDFTSWVTSSLARIEHELERCIPLTSPASLGEVMRYAVLDGGKRLRPLLLLATYEAFQPFGHSATKPAAWQQGIATLSLRAACAVELIHAYSLVHDDLPCMDNDVLRRGKPTVHVRYGQAQALLAGDAIQALAFEILVEDVAAELAQTDCDVNGLSELALVQVRLCRWLGSAAGAFGMAGGQAIDLVQVGNILSKEDLRTMHQLKTGALLHASIMMGAELSGLEGAMLSPLSDFGHAIGLLFQVVDDILDVVGDSATLGKTAGKDALAGKPTYVSVMGLEASQRYANELEAQALQALQALAHTQPEFPTHHLKSLLTWVAGRTH